MYKIQKAYYTGTNETKVRLTLQEPYRDFVVSFTGDMTAVDNDILEQRAIEKIAKEFNPAYAFKEIEQKMEEQEKAQKSILETIILSKDLNEAQKKNILDQYEDWEIGVSYKAGKKVKHNGKVFEVVQPHTSQANWIPSSTPALYKEFLSVKIKDEAGNESEVVAEFKKPTGAHDAYKQGDKVSFNGQIYQSKNDGNAHSPEAYPQGWELVEEKEEGQEGKEEEKEEGQE